MKDRVFLDGLLVGILVGIFAISIAQIMGQRRYSDAIRTCIQQIGPNK